MTKREFLEAVIAGTVTEEVIDFAQKSIVKLDETNLKRKEKAGEKATEQNAAKAVLIDKLVGFLGTEPKTATDMVAMFDGVERPDGKPFNRQYVTRLANAAVEMGKAGAVDVKVKGKGKQKGYVLIVE